MSHETLNAGRLLLFGKDAVLLETRAMVLRSAGMAAELTVNVDDLETRIAAPNSTYRLVICCYTATEVECAEVVAIASRNSATLMMMERLLSPPELIAQVSSLIEKLGSGLDDSKPGRSR